MNVITRHAQNDFDAFRTAQGMENAGAVVFSITYDGQDQKHGALLPSSRFIVWAKFQEPVTPQQIDVEIEKEFEQ